MSTLSTSYSGVWSEEGEDLGEVGMGGNDVSSGWGRGNRELRWYGRRKEMLMTLCFLSLEGKARRNALGFTICVMGNGPNQRSSNLLMSGIEWLVRNAALCTSTSSLMENGEGEYLLEC